MVVGSISWDVCIEVVKNITSEQITSLAIMTGALIVGNMLLLYFYFDQFLTNKKLKDYLRRKKLLNDYEDYQKDRKLL